MGRAEVAVISWSRESAGIGLDAATGQLQLNAFEPVILACVHESAALLSNAIRMLIDNYLADLALNPAACQANLEAGTALATFVVPAIGHGRAAEVAKLALKGGTLREAAALLEPEVLPLLDEILGIGRGESDAPGSR